MLNFNQLRAFYEVAKGLSFSAAAKRLFVTQPAVTAQIKLFESSCNLNLFRKKDGQLFLTDEGQTLLKYAERIFALEKQIEESVDSIHKANEGNLRIGTTKTYARYFMPILIRPFLAAFPGVLLELDEGSSLRMTESLLELRNSLAIVAKVMPVADIEFHPILLEEVALIVSPSSRLAKKRQVTFSEIREEHVIMKEVGSGCRKIVEEHYDSAGIRPLIVAQISNVELIKEMVKQGEGISFVERSAVRSELSRGDLISVRMKNRRITLPIYLAYLKNDQLSPAARHFVSFLRPILAAQEPATSVDGLCTLLVEKSPPIE